MPANFLVVRVSNLFFKVTTDNCRDFKARLERERERVCNVRSCVVQSNKWQRQICVYLLFKNNKNVFEKCFEEIIVIKNYKVCNVSFGRGRDFKFQMATRFVLMECSVHLYSQQGVRLAHSADRHVCHTF